MDFTGEAQTRKHWTTLKSHYQSTETILEEKYYKKKSWFVKPNSNCIFVWYVFYQLQSGAFPKESAFLWKQTAAESSQHHLWLQDSRCYPPVIKQFHSLHANNHLLNLVGKKPKHWFDLSWFGDVGNDPRYTLNMNGCKMIYVMATENWQCHFIIGCCWLEVFIHMHLSI